MANADLTQADISPLTDLSEADFRRLVVGYTSAEVYAIEAAERDDEIAFRFRLTRPQQPYAKRWEFSAGQFTWYRSLLALGLSFGAQKGSELIGLAICGTTEWSKVINVWELHVAEEHRGQGTGRALLRAVEEEGARRGYRSVSCETQSTNVPAIRFYRRAGYSAQAVDLTFYSNEDLARGEVSVFMRKPVG